jgi:MoaA/NifB/PqqE/SkfB family radical SAM enzyme
LSDPLQPSFRGRNHHPPTRPTILWDMLAPCNFSCDYCYSERLTVRRPRLRDQSVLRQLAAFAERLPGWNVNLSGGEPLLHPDVVALAAGLSRQGNRIGLYTNLSRSATAAQFTRSVDPSGVEFINAGVHAVQRRAEDPELRMFAQDFSMLERAGFPIHASYILHPENIHRARADVERLHDLAIRVRIQVFRGVLDGVTYPAGFSDEQLAFVAAWEADLDRGRDVRTDATGQGGNCMAGAVYLEMDPDGSCWRCASYRSMRREPLGNLFEGSLAVNEGPERCRVFACLSCRQGHAFSLGGLRDLFPHGTSPAQHKAVPAGAAPSVVHLPMPGTRS